MASQVNLSYSILMTTYIATQDSVSQLVLRFKLMLMAVHYALTAMPMKNLIWMIALAGSKG